MALNFCLEAEHTDIRAENEGNTYLFTCLPNLVQADKQLLHFMSSFIPDWDLYAVFWLYLFISNAQKSKTFKFKKTYSSLYPYS